MEIGILLTDTISVKLLRSCGERTHGGWTAMTISVPDELDLRFLHSKQ